MSQHSAARWLPHSIGNQTYEILNFDHPAVADLVMDEMDTGVDVYYDNRWELTEQFSDWITKNPEIVADRTILALGAGAGLENLILAKYAKHIFINDLSDLSLQFCEEQLKRNRFTNFELLPGDFAGIDTPPDCDLAVACFTIYCRDTANSVQTFLDRFDGEVIIVNEYLKEFRSFLESIEREHETINEGDGGVAIRFPPK